MRCMIIVLGGGLSKMTINRVAGAAKLARRVPCGLMLVGTNDEAVFMYRITRVLGLGDREVILVGGSRNTLDNAYYAKSALSRLGFKGRLILVTSRFHSWRAYQLFRNMLGRDYELSLLPIDDEPDDRLRIKEVVSRILAIVSIALLRIIGDRGVMALNGLYEVLKPW